MRHANFNNKFFFFQFSDSNVSDEKYQNGAGAKESDSKFSSKGRKFDSFPLSAVALTKYNNGKGVKDDPEKGPITKADFELAIELTGYGKFHYILLAICGLVSTSEEMDVISMSFILPSAQCDLHLNTQTKGWLNSIIFIGMMVGAYFWGSLADSMGRKRVLIVISVMNALCIVASSFTQNYILFMLFRFLNGAA